MSDEARGLPAWYALRVRANHEKAVRRYLDHFAVESYLPVYPQTSRWSDRTQRLERTLFPGYVFARCGGDELAGVVHLPGVCGVLGGVRPAVIPALEIDSVRLVIASMRPLIATDFTVGERVTIAHGALKGVSGVVERLKGALRLVVTIELLGRGVAVELDVDALERAA